jgi:predicted phage-related endonuclease
MEAGTRMEPVILEWFGDELGVTVERCGTLYQSKQWPWLGCTPDGLAHFQNPAVDVFVQAKNALFGSDWSIDADGILSPKRVWIQVQTEMAVTGKEAIYVAAICGGWDFKWALVHRDDEFIDGVIVPKTREFMDAVEAKEPLPVDFTDSGARALAKLYPEETPEKTMALPIEFMDLDDEYKVLVLAERTCKEQRTEIRNRVMEAMGEAAYGTLPDGTVWSWRTQHTEIKAKPAGSRTNRVLRRKGGK